MVAIRSSGIFAKSKIKDSSSLYSNWKGQVMEAKHKIWFEENGLMVFETGFNVFFKELVKCRSLNAAAKKLNISYRLVWGKIKDAEERLGVKLVEINPGEKKMHLTENAKALLVIFDDIEEEIKPIMKKALKRIANLKKRALRKKRGVDRK
jgi:molybdate transport system regulatory protein